MIIARVMTNSPSRPLKLYLANAYAAIELIIKVRIVAIDVTITLFVK